jgi:hypothetical protein
MHLLWLTIILSSVIHSKASPIAEAEPSADALPAPYAFPNPLARPLRVFTGGGGGVGGGSRSSGGKAGEKSAKIGNKPKTSTKDKKKKKKDKSKPGSPDSVDLKCVYNKASTVKISFMVIIPKDGSKTQKGFDAPGNCEKGLVDNMKGDWMAVYSWTCVYSRQQDQSACATFWTNSGSQEQAIKAVGQMSGGQLQMDGCVEGNPSCPPGYG